MFIYWLLVVQYQIGYMSRSQSMFHRLALHVWYSNIQFVNYLNTTTEEESIGAYPVLNSSVASFNFMLCTIIEYMWVNLTLLHTKQSNRNSIVQYLWYRPWSLQPSRCSVHEQSL
jgi:hypothetical protein